MPQIKAQYPEIYILIDWAQAVWWNVPIVNFSQLAELWVDWLVYSSSKWMNTASLWIAYIWERLKKNLKILTDIDPNQQVVMSWMLPEPFWEHSNIWVALHPARLHDFQQAIALHTNQWYLTDNDFSAKHTYFQHLKQTFLWYLDRYKNIEILTESNLYVPWIVSRRIKTKNQHWSNKQLYKALLDVWIYPGTYIDELDAIRSSRSIENTEEEIDAFFQHFSNVYDQLLLNEL